MLKLLKKFTKTEWALTALAFGLILVQVWMNLTMPDYMSEITMLVQTEGSAMADILAAGGKMLLCAVGSLIAAACTAVCAARISSIFLPVCVVRYLARCSPFQWRRWEDSQHPV